MPALDTTESLVIKDAYPTYWATATARHGRFGAEAVAEVIRLRATSPGFLGGLKSPKERPSNEQESESQEEAVIPASARLRALYESMTAMSPAYEAIISDRVLQATERIELVMNRWFLNAESLIGIGSLAEKLYETMDAMNQRLSSTVGMDVAKLTEQFRRTAASLYISAAVFGAQKESEDSQAIDGPSLDPALVRKVNAYMAGSVVGQTEPLRQDVGRRALRFAAELSFVTGSKPSISAVDADSATVQMVLDAERKLFVEVQPEAVEAVIYYKGKGVNSLGGNDESSILRALAGLA